VADKLLKWSFNGCPSDTLRSDKVRQISSGEIKAIVTRLVCIAASIVKVGDLNVVPLYYKEEMLMNVGVSLPHPPRYARTQAYYVKWSGDNDYAERTAQ